jgi:hypothetical protein
VCYVANKYSPLSSPSHDQVIISHNQDAQPGPKLINRSIDREPSQPHTSDTDAVHRELGGSPSSESSESLSSDSGGVEETGVSVGPSSLAPSMLGMMALLPPSSVSGATASAPLLSPFPALDEKALSLPSYLSRVVQSLVSSSASRSIGSALSFSGDVASVGRRTHRSCHNPCSQTLRQCMALRTPFSWFFVFLRRCVIL